MRVYIYSRADHTEHSAKPFWGDFWVKELLRAAFLDLRHSISHTPYRTDLNVFCWGKAPAKTAVPVTGKSREVAWFYSHPALMTRAELSRYGTVFCSSRLWVEEQKELIASAGVDVRHIPQCSHLWGCHGRILESEPRPRPDWKNFVNEEDRLPSPMPDVVFVGNARPGRGGRPVVEQLLSQKPNDFLLGLWGRGWLEQGVCTNVSVERYFPFERLQYLYAASKAVLIDHHPDMAQGGFIKHQVFDVIAAGGIPVVDKVRTGSDWPSGVPWPVYENAEEALAKLRTVLAMDDNARALLHEDLVRSVPVRTFVDAARSMTATVTGD